MFERIVNGIGIISMKLLCIKWKNQITNRHLYVHRINMRMIYTKIFAVFLIYLEGRFEMIFIIFSAFYDFSASFCNKTVQFVVLNNEFAQLFSPLAHISHVDRASRLHGLVSLMYLSTKQVPDPVLSTGVTNVNNTYRIMNLIA